MSQDLSNVKVIGDNVLVRLCNEKDKTNTGLYLPPGINETSPIRAGWVMAVGPGFPIDVSEEYGPGQQRVNYIPVQVSKGEKVFFLQRHAIEIKYNEEDLLVVPEKAIVLSENVFDDI